VTKDEELAFWKAEAERWRQVAYTQAQAVIKATTLAEEGVKPCPWGLIGRGCGCPTRCTREARRLALKAWGKGET
jgi:hypothetical protein